MASRSERRWNGVRLSQRRAGECDVSGSYLAKVNFLSSGVAEKPVEIFHDNRPRIPCCICKVIFRLMAAGWTLLLSLTRRSFLVEEGEGVNIDKVNGP